MTENVSVVFGYKIVNQKLYNNTLMSERKSATNVTI